MSLQEAAVSCICHMHLFGRSLLPLTSLCRAYAFLQQFVSSCLRNVKMPGHHLFCLPTTISARYIVDAEYSHLVDLLSWVAKACSCTCREKPYKATACASHGRHDIMSQFAVMMNTTKGQYSCQSNVGSLTLPSWLYSRGLVS